MYKKLLFISNASNSQKAIEIVKYEIEFSCKLPDELKLSSQTAENTIYLIDVHYSYENQKLQQQPGVDFYRRLLKNYESITNGLDNLKVVFYSPLPKDFLINDKPDKQCHPIHEAISVFSRIKNRSGSFLFVILQAVFTADR